MQKLLIADSSEEFCMALVDALKGAYIVKVCQEGRETLKTLQSFAPDILVLDLLLPGLDGISLLHAASDLEPRPVVLAVTRFASDYVMEHITRLGVGYVMMKPVDIHAVVSRLAELTERLTPQKVTPVDDRTAVTNMMLTLSVPTKLRGYSCLREALLLTMKNPDQSVTKELYPAVAAICGGNAIQVEHSIRSAINAAWLNRNEQVWQQYFLPGPDGAVPRPTNAAFISRLADRLITRCKHVG